MEHIKLSSYRVWDRSVRWFHWINLLSVLALIGIGLVIYNGKTLGLAGEAKILMKELHVWAGYLFAVNLTWRIVQGFRGSHFTRWRTTLTFGGSYLSDLRAYLASMRSGEPHHYLGHNPLGKLMVTLLFLLMFSQAITGLLLAGTDLYYPPLGGWIAEWVAPVGVDPASLVPGDKSMVDVTAWDEMRTMRKPFIIAHVWVFFILLGAVVLHMAGVVVSELRERSGLVSAMFSGYKTLPRRPVDLPKTDE
jgi:Ni/Fe-hydrogenase 1 B-type cytochrome subunit